MKSFDLTSLLRSLPFSYLAVLPDADFTIAEVSDSYLAAANTTREAIVGRSMLEVFSEHPANLHARGPVRLRESFQQVLDTKAAHAMRIQRYHSLGTSGAHEEHFWMPTNYPMLDAAGEVACIIHRVQNVTLLSRSDLEARKPDASDVGHRRLDDRLHSRACDLQQVSDLIVEEETRWLSAVAKAEEAGEKLALAVDAADIGTFYCPVPLGKIIWNKVCKTHFFLPPGAEVDFDLFYKRIHPDDRARTEAAIALCLTQNRPYDVEYRVVAPDGRMRWIRAKGRAYHNDAGQATRFDGITIDVSTQKEAESGLRRMDRQKDEFLAMLAHELRNPLAPIRAAAQFMLVAPPGDERVRESCDIINRQVGHMTALIDDLLDVSRVTRGLVVLDKQVVSLQDIAADALEQTRPLLLLQKHQLQLSMPADPVAVCGDRKRLVQVIANLLHNAAKYTPEHGSLVLEVMHAEGRALARVSDNGIGIAPALVPHVFDLFTQATRTPDRRQGGLGVGLALVRSLVSLHGGEVSCASAGVGTGSQFTVSLPLHAAVTAAPLRNTPLPQEPVQSCLEVMIVDDNEDAAVMLAYAVEASGHHVSVEYGSHEALTTLAGRRDGPVDVCLLDIGLPEIDGNEVARRLRANPDTRDIALIAVTGYGQPRDLAAARDAGFDRCLVKPVDILHLNALLLQISTHKAHGEPLRLAF